MMAELSKAINPKFKYRNSNGHLLSAYYVQAYKWFLFFLKANKT